MKILSNESAARIEQIVTSYTQEQIDGFKNTGGDELYYTLAGLVRQSMKIAAIGGTVTGGVIYFYAPTGSVLTLPVTIVDSRPLSSDSIYRHVNGLDYAITLGDLDDKGDRSPIMVGVGLHDGKTYVRHVDEFFDQHASGRPRFTHISGPKFKLDGPLSVAVE